MEDRPRFQTGPREIRPSGIIGGPRETWPGWNCAPTSHTERARIVTLHLYTGAPELYPNNPRPKLGKLEIDKQKRTNGQQYLAFFEVFKWIPIVPMVRAKRRVRRLPLRLRPPDLSRPPGPPGWLLTLFSAIPKLEPW